jgi:hypothetical protein
MPAENFEPQATGAAGGSLGVTTDFRLTGSWAMPRDVTTATISPRAA